MHVNLVARRVFRPLGFFALALTGGNAPSMASLGLVPSFVISGDNLLRDEEPRAEQSA